jgi:flagellin
MRINTNVSALNSWRQLGMTDKAMGLSLEKLSSGFRINRAADDAAGLAISEKMKAQINGLNQAVRNAQDGISLIQTAEGGLIEVHDMLQRMRTLALQAANGTYDDDPTNGDLAKLDAEFKQLIEEIDEVAKNRVQFNGKILFDGSVPSIQLQIGPNTTDILTVDMAQLDAVTLGLTDTLSINATSTEIATVITTLDDAIETVSATRSNLGAYQNRLEHTINNLGVSAENLSAANSRIRDVDMAAEMMNFTRNQILIQAGTAMLAQANARPQSVLQLLG